MLVGWSYAGRVIGDYFTAHGVAALAGINYVNVSSTLGNPAFLGPDVALLEPQALLASTANGMIEGTVRFLRACFAIQPEPADVQSMLAPYYVPMGLAGRLAEYTEAL